MSRGFSILPLGDKQYTAIEYFGVSYDYHGIS